MTISKVNQYLANFPEKNTIYLFTLSFYNRKVRAIHSQQSPCNYCALLPLLRSNLPLQCASRCCTSPSSEAHLSWARLQHTLSQHCRCALVRFLCPRLTKLEPAHRRIASIWQDWENCFAMVQFANHKNQVQTWTWPAVQGAVQQIFRPKPHREVCVQRLNEPGPTVPNLESLCEPLEITTSADWMALMEVESKTMCTILGDMRQSDWAAQPTSESLDICSLNDYDMKHGTL